MVSEKKIEFLAKQGFSRDVINVFINCGVDRNLLWFLGAHKKGMIEHLNGEEIKSVNKYLESQKDSTKYTYSQVLELSKLYERNEERKNRNRIYNFANGYYVSILNEQDLRDEGVVMANCVGTYRNRVSHGQVGILALKQSNGKTVCHIEVFKNGLIGQNYAKANSQMNKENWLMVLEFFNNNSKKVNLSDLFGESYVVSAERGYIDDVILSVPTSVNIILQNGVKKIDQYDGFEAKRFSPFHKRNHCVLKISDKLEVLNWIEERKQEVIKFYDDLMTQVEMTSASALYLSDEIKEKIFGSKKGAYLMKGDNYNISEIDPRYGSEEKCPEEPAMLLEREELAPDMDIEAPRMVEEDAPARRRPHLRIGVPPRDMPEPIAAQAEMDEVEMPRDIEVNERRIAGIDRGVFRGQGQVIPDVVQQEVYPDEQLAVVELPVNEEDMVIAVDGNGNEYQVNINDVEEVDMVEAPFNDGIIPPIPFDEILRRAT